MTANQLKYWDLQRQKNADAEVARANKERERLNAETLAETKRANLAREIETNRSNFAREMETLRSNYAHEREANRANTANELLKSQGLIIQSQANDLQRMRDLEQARSNRQQEGIRSRQNDLTSQKTALDYSQRQSELSETRRYHDTSLDVQKVSTVSNLVGSLGNAIIRALGAKGQKRR